MFQTVENICDLPNELLCYIFEFLKEDYDQLNASAVCRKWRSLYKEYKLCTSVKYTLTKWEDLEELEEVWSSIGLLRITHLQLSTIQFKSYYDYRPIFSKIEELVVENSDFGMDPLLGLFMNSQLKSIAFKSSQAIFYQFEDDSFLHNLEQNQNLKKIFSNLESLEFNRIHIPSSDHFTKFMSIFTPGKLKRMIFSKLQMESDGFAIDSVDPKYSVIRDYLAIPQVTSNIRELSFEDSRSNSSHLETVLNLDDLKLTSFHSGFFRRFDANWMNLLKFEYLKDLNVCFTDDYFNFDMTEMKKLINLENLSLASLCHIKCYGSILAPESASKLKSLSLPSYYGDNESLKSILNPLVNLRSLDMSYNRSGFDDSILTLICEKMPKLKHLNITKCFRVRGKGLVENTLANLESLFLQGVPLKNTIIKKFFHFKRLRKIDFTKCKFMNDEMLITLSQQVPSLKSLGLSFTKITDRGLVAMAKNLKLLSALDLTGCLDLTRNAVEEIFDDCLHLRVLEEPIFVDDESKMLKLMRLQMSNYYDVHYEPMIEDDSEEDEFQNVLDEYGGMSNEENPVSLNDPDNISSEEEEIAQEELPEDDQNNTEQPSEEDEGSPEESQNNGDDEDKEDEDDEDDDEYYTPDRNDRLPLEDNTEDLSDVFIINDTFYIFLNLGFTILLFQIFDLFK